MSLWEFLERVEDLEPWSFEVSVVPRSDRQSVSSRRCRDVAVLDGHALAGLLQQSLLIRPDICHRHVESVDGAMQRIDEPCEPCLQRLPLPTFLCAHPVRQLRDDDSAGVAALLLGLYLLVVWRGLRVITVSRDAFGAIAAGGIVVAFLFQIFVNVGMTIGIAPITGIPLPFVSVGGSAMIANLLAIGVLEAIYVRGVSARRRRI